VFHIELRQFPHNVCRFNLSEQELRVLVGPWSRERWIELGGRKWSPHQARLTILEGPHLAVQELSMGRGWRNAQRRSEDVTDRLLAAAKAPLAHDGGSSQSTSAPSTGPSVPSTGPSAPSTGPSAPSTDVALEADSLGLELLTMLGEAPASLSDVWQLARSRYPERLPSECLAVAEEAIRSLLHRRLVVLVASAGEADGNRQPGGPSGRAAAGAEVERLLQAPESWFEDERAAVLVRRA
jgi:hypothetical protein